MTAQADGLLLSDNTISYVIKQGIYMVRAENSTISNNTINNVDGNGFRLFSANFTSVFENDVADCTGDGFYLNSGINTTIHWNSVTNVSEYAVNLESPTANYSIKYNTFQDNGATCQVYDDGTSNIVSHNYYDDWNSPDADANGYVDTPYVFEGDSENQDEFPLAVAGVVPAEISNGLPMELILIAGAFGAIVIVTSLVLFKRR